ncbi:hypothetical protein L3Q82_001996 [Scortum barcoo]|uniref:Uncharacterized protein n=1 Tax=Scortum barcoo TaxID=214431 RepID=A0ACB8W1T6_9TELE|nr:hypothetical protein L3Q82_001996 [Scortum barcoo]
MNVIRRCYQQLFGAFGPSLFDSLPVSKAPGPVIAALQQCHQSATSAGNPTGSVRVRGKRVVHIPGGVMKLVASTCPEKFSGQSVLFEPPESAHDGDLGCTNLLFHDILLLDDVPVRQSKTRKDAFPLPGIEENLNALSGARWFSTIDLASGYNQVPVGEQDRPKTAFCTPFGLFEFNRMLFGLCNAPSTFQQLMQKMFGDQQGQSLLLYLDDIIIYSSSVEQHLQRLEMVLDRLKTEGLKAKLEKCAFFRQEVGYLGHVISSQGSFH